jgi:hypothetical protein
VLQSPETVPSGQSLLGESGHCALEGVAVQIRQSGEQNAAFQLLIFAVGLDSGFHGGNASAFVNRHPDVLFPTRGGQGQFCKKFHGFLIVDQAFGSGLKPI